MIHIFLWSLPNEPRIAAEWTRIHGDFRVYPLSLAAWHTARALLGEERTVDISLLVSPDERRLIFRRAGDLAEHVIGELKQSAYPWCAGTDYLQMINATYAFLLWRRLIREARSRFGDGVVHNTAVFSRSSVPGQVFRDHRLLDLAADAANGLVCASRARKLFEWITEAACTVAYPLLKVPGLCVKPVDKRRRKSRVDLLVMALDEADRRIQAPLVERLVRTGRLSVQWTTVTHSRTRASRDEESADKIEYQASHIRPIPTDIRELYRWRNPLLKQLSRRLLAREYARALASFFDTEIAAPVIKRFAALLSIQHEHFLLYHGARLLLEEADAGALMMNSSYADMLATQICAERMNIPLIRMPHGAENIHGPRQQWRARRIGIYGRAGVDALQRRFGKDCCAEVVGALHFGAFAAGKIKRDNAGNEKSALLILSPGGTLNYPDTAQEEEEDVAAIAVAVHNWGGRLIVRCHPRQVNTNYYDYVLMSEMERHSDWSLSDGSDSLVQAVGRSSAVVVRSWSGAAVQCLYGGVPIVSWMPRPGLETGDELLDQFPCRAHDAAGLQSILHSLSNDAGYAETILKAQQKILEYYISRPYDDPYAQAESFVIRAVGEISRFVEKSPP